MSDPYEDAICIYAGLSCDKCGEYFYEENTTDEAMAKHAKELGWHVIEAWSDIVNTDDWQILCPKCKP